MGSAARAPQSMTADDRFARRQRTTLIRAVSTASPAVSRTV